MRYIRVFYMCPKCSAGFFFDKDDDFSTKCPECNVEMVCMEEKWTSTEEDEERERIWNSSIVSSPIVTCPYCNSVNTSKISTTSKIVDTALFGFFGEKRKHQWHCNSCNSDF